jgi:FG-GAP-like repeat
MKWTVITFLVPAVLALVVQHHTIARALQDAGRDPLGYGLLDGPSAITMADLNRDGRPEIVVTNRRANAVSVLLNNGNASFTVKSRYATGSAPSAVVAFDLNRDGKQDIAVANSGSDSVSVFFGNGDGTFTRAKEYSTGPVPSALIVSDLNHDRSPDLIVANRYGNSVSVLLGKANATLSPKTDYSAGFLPYSILLNDVNRDGKQDLLVTSTFDHAISILPGNGDGTFGPRKRFAEAKRSCAMLLGGLTGDRPSIIVPSRYGYLYSVQLFREDGSQEYRSEYLSGKGPRTVLAADFNQDGKLDLAVVNAGHSAGEAGSVFVFLGNGAGAFESKANYVTGNASHSLAVGDLNRDGKLDIAVLNGSYDFGGSVSILFGNGDGTFGGRADYSTGGYQIWVNFGEDSNGKSEQKTGAVDKPKP